MDDGRLEQINREMQALWELIVSAKPEDRSHIDRRFAILITEYEKMEAYFRTYILRGEHP